MIRVRRLFLHDMGRKLLALGLACLTWWYVHNQITDERPESFDIAVSAAPVSPTSGSLTIFEPDGWVLTGPALGSNVEIALKGEQGRLDRLLASGVGATFDPEPALIRLVSRSPELLTQQVQLQLRELEWNIPDAAGFVDETMTGAILLTFEREQSLEVDLKAAMLVLAGEVNANFELRRGQASIEPNRVTLRGPASRMAELGRRLAEWRAGAEERPIPDFLGELNVDGATGKLIAAVRLSPAWADDIHMEPEVVTASVPVVERLPDPVEFDMPDPYLFNAGVAGTEGWGLAGNPLGLWRLSFDPLPGFRPPPDVDVDWIREKLVFFVNLEELANLDRTEHDLPLHWRYVGEDRREQMNDALRIEPSGAASARVKMKRIQENE